MSVRHIIRVVLFSVSVAVCHTFTKGHFRVVVLQCLSLSSVFILKVFIFMLVCLVLYVGHNVVL